MWVSASNTIQKLICVQFRVFARLQGRLFSLSIQSDLGSVREIAVRHAARFSFASPQQVPDMVMDELGGLGSAQGCSIFPFSLPSSFFALSLLAQTQTIYSQPLTSFDKKTWTLAYFLTTSLVYVCVFIGQCWELWSLNTAVSVVPQTKD